jgi:3D (Asp-Asp-Asp) domain-containing protein
MSQATSRARAALCAAVSVGVAFASACTTPPSSREEPLPLREIIVTASAYNSTVAQTDSTPSVTAHGVRLEPGMRVIAVSRDLEAMGLRAGTRVEIEGVPGVWEVGDRMPARRRRAIDLYMGVDIDRARVFGRREVRLRWPASRAAPAR